MSNFPFNARGGVVHSEKLPVPAAETLLGDFGCLITDRTPDRIAARHALTVDGLKGFLQGRKRILDIGPGESSLNEIVPSDSILINIDLLHRSQINTKSNSSPWVVGLGDVLPFADESFDAIIATSSLPYWSISDNQVERFFAETYRCLSSLGGVCLVSTIKEEDKEYFNPEIKRERQTADDVHIQPIEEPGVLPGQLTLKIKKGGEFTEDEAYRFFEVTDRQSEVA